MNQFRIIAIKTPHKCVVDGKNMLKVLAPDTVFPFCQNYIFPNGTFDVVVVDEEKNIDLYSFNSSTSINISAIVGANGSGKSSLVELFMMANYNLGANFGMLKCTCEQDDEPCECDEKGAKKVLETKKEFALEILFCNRENVLVKIKFASGKIKKSYYEKVNTEYKIKLLNNGTKEEELKVEDLADFGYSIVVNYSHHAVNSLEIGKWVIPLFHKNDGYQTPIVINPMRTMGNININRENELLKDRLLTNLLEQVKESEEDALKNSLRNLGNGKIATHLVLKPNAFKVAKKYYTRRIKNLQENERELRVIQHVKENSLAYFNRQKFTEQDKLKAVFGLDLGQVDFKGDEIIMWGCLYLFNKAKSISKNYKTYHSEDLKFKNNVFELLKDDPSHVAFKFKRVVYFLKYYHLWKPLISKNKPIPLGKITNVIGRIKRIEKNKLGKIYIPRTIELIPPSFFDVDIRLTNGLAFSELSSGERQKIHSTSSIIYHIINLNSVKGKELKGQKKVFLKYKNITVILDEIELYFHPNWQRTFISDLLDYLKKVNNEHLKSIEGINFIFVTHSPFILSDIPHQHVLMLDKQAEDQPTSKTVPSRESGNLRTFGANIHELLSTSFFMDSTTGEYAKGRINEIIKFHNEVRNADPPKLRSLKADYLAFKKDFTFIAQNTGEDFIRGLLLNHLEFIEETLSKT